MEKAMISFLRESETIEGLVAIEVDYSRQLEGRLRSRTIDPKQS
jgi:hypothetical protein